MTPPADPWATINRPAPTVYFGDGDPGATVRMPAPNPTAPLGSANPTVHLGAPHPTAPQPATPYQTAPHQSGYQAAPAQGEVRFGPGVPAPVAAPAWPAAKKSRPLWRRLVSVLSGLITLALVAVVGLYLWQRLSPLEVQAVTVAVPKPAGTACDVTVDVVATVTTNGKAGTIRYQWLRSDAAPGAILAEQVGTDQRTATLTLRWTFSGVGTTGETATVNIVEPSPMQATTRVAYNCGG
ncbi:hypothetical protein KOI35_21315 [Actinoplanes bogorensis]|uniref:Ig-like domain-containing protein n=2 Tax=Paractinoplanes bogorensis TaxID=1610840 RepID=A0ABS5YRJ1_9ACTN|nr:hypothetical protein [Actinoplanes bogorensis]